MKRRRQRAKRMQRDAWISPRRWLLESAAGVNRQHHHSDSGVRVHGAVASSASMTKSTPMPKNAAGEDDELSEGADDDVRNREDEDEAMMAGGGRLSSSHKARASNGAEHPLSLKSLEKEWNQSTAPPVRRVHVSQTLRVSARGRSRSRSRSKSPSRSPSRSPDKQGHAKEKDKDKKASKALEKNKDKRNNTNNNKKDGKHNDKGPDKGPAAGCTRGPSRSQSLSPKHGAIGSGSSSANKSKRTSHNDHEHNDDDDDDDSLHSLSSMPHKTYALHLPDEPASLHFLQVPTSLRA